MTAAQYRHLRGFLAGYLGRSDFFLVGGRETMELVLPDMTYLIRPRGQRPFAARNRYFSLSLRAPEASSRQKEILSLLRRATQSYARSRPWLIDAIREGKAFLENSPASLRYLASTPNPYQALFRDFEAIRGAEENAAGVFEGLFEFDLLQDLLFRVARTVSARDMEAASALAARVPARGAVSPPPGLRLVFINLLGGGNDFCAELSGWIAGCPGALELGAAAWPEVARHMNQETVVFCMGLEEACVRFLVENRGRFRHVAFWDAGMSRPRRAVSRELLGCGKASLFLTSPNNFFGALYHRLRAEDLIPYIPVVSRAMLRYRLSVAPEYDFFVCANCEQDLTFLLRHRSFFRERKIMIGVKRCPHHPGLRKKHERQCSQAYRAARKLFARALFVPTVPRDMHAYLWQMARSVVVMYPDWWNKTSYTLASALLSGRGLITSAHPAVSRIDPACFIPYSHRSLCGDRELAERFCDQRRSRRAASLASRYACERLELARVVENIVTRTLERA